MQDLSVTLIQTDLYWENSIANLANLEEKIAQISTQTDLIILPEMFNTGFTMNAKSVAEPMNFTTFKWLRQQAKKANAVVAGSFIVKEGDKYFNRLIWMRPDGTSEQYDKRHLFRMGNEHLTFTGGTERIIVELKGWKICPLICYDLRFPVWSRQAHSHQGTKGQSEQIEAHSHEGTKAQSEVESDQTPNIECGTPPERTTNYDLLIYVANWPAVRSQVWDVLLKARAIENQSYCIGVNRVGNDGMGLNYSGNSAIIDFKGNPVFYQKELEVIHSQILNYQDLIDFRTKFPAYLDADDFIIR
jgi:omega-amidase